VELEVENRHETHAGDLRTQSGPQALNISKPIFRPAHMSDQPAQDGRDFAGRRGVKDEDQVACHRRT